MSATAETNKPTSPGVPESPTTARPLEMDDDDVQESGVLTEDGSHHPSTTTTTAAPVASPGPPAPAAATEEAPPPKPPRPVSEQQKNEQTLKEAFPSVEPSVIKAVLRASRGQIEPAFNALLEMTDPDAAQNEQEEETPAPPPPPRPQPGTAGLTQMEADELYARQLAEQYENAASSYEQRTSSREAPYHSRVRQQTGLQPDREADENRGRSFLDDDLPEIQENLRKGFIETQSKVNTWFNNLKKKIDDTLDDGPQNRQGQVSGRRPGDSSRRSGDYERYDADPQVLSDDFAGMRFTSDGTPVRNNRPLSNPNLYKPPPPIPGQSGDGRRVAFKDSTESIDAYESSPRLPPKDTAPAATKQSKWQPLSTVDPSPIAENDPFILGDSDDERDAKSKTSGAQGIKMEDSERLKKAAAEAMADSLVDEPKKPEAAAPKKE